MGGGGRRSPPPKGNGKRVGGKSRLGNDVGKSKGGGGMARVGGIEGMTNGGGVPIVGDGLENGGKPQDDGGYGVLGKEGESAKGYGCHKISHGEFDGVTVNPAMLGSAKTRSGKVLSNPFLNSSSSLPSSSYTSSSSSTSLKAANDNGAIGKDVLQDSDVVGDNGVATAAINVGMHACVNVESEKDDSCQDSGGEESSDEEDTSSASTDDEVQNLGNCNNEIQIANEVLDHVLCGQGATVLPNVQCNSGNKPISSFFAAIFSLCMVNNHLDVHGSTRKSGHIQPPSPSLLPPTRPLTSPHTSKLLPIPPQTCPIPPKPSHLANNSTSTSFPNPNPLPNGLDPPSLLGKPPSSTKPIPPPNAWRKKGTFKPLPKCSLAEISSDGTILMDESSSNIYAERLEECALVGKTLGKPFSSVKW